MFGLLRSWRRNRVLKRSSLDQALWERVAGRFAFVQRLTDEERERLRNLVILFLHEKQISAAGGLALTDEMRLGIAIQACILVLNLGLDSYEGWVEIIVYPDEFVPRHEFRNEHGLIEIDDTPYAGQAWLRGPVILSWADVEYAWEGDGANVVIHEFAHKLDMLNGEANGFPPLHAGMRREDWTAAFTTAYEDFSRRVAAGEHTEIDPYAAESPGEFFAVLSEAFFEIPDLVRETYPAVYRQLALFYRQDPASRELPREFRLRKAS
ncbi:MAG TPA: M90 family metallopeptidase [Burkholderiales bacterium]|jgi:Mlc titration factor MtfA (ptsG expression regulator)|nr:M90 family metallopeptidase [Burkholderiales bacterium]